CKRPLLLQPRGESRNARPPGSGWLQPQFPGDHPSVGDVVALVSGPPIGVAGFGGTADQILYETKKLSEADRVLWATAEVEGPTLNAPNVLPCRDIGIHRIRDIQ